jgi:hypothetical protein
LRTKAREGSTRRGMGSGPATTCSGRRANGGAWAARRGYDDAAACGVGMRGGTGEGRKGRFGANGSHRARTDGHWPVSACRPGGTAAARTAWRGVRVPVFKRETVQCTPV